MIFKNYVILCFDHHSSNGTNWVLNVSDWQVCREDSEKRTMQGCNDCSFDFEGNLWVTAPAGEIAPHPYRRSMEVRQSS